MQLHPAKNILDAYTLKALSKTELTEMILHLDGCDECSAYVKEHSLAPGTRGDSNVLPMTRSPSVTFHLNYDEHLAPYVHGTAAASVRTAVDEHMVKCKECNFLLYDLQTFVASENEFAEANEVASSRSRSLLLRPFSLIPIFGALAVVFALSAAVYILVRDTTSVDPSPNIVSIKDGERSENEVRPTENSNFDESSNNAPPAVLPNGEKDAEPSKKIPENNEIAAIDGLPLEFKQEINEAVRSGSMIDSPDLDLLARNITLRSGGGALNLNGDPNGVVVRETVPLISWMENVNGPYSVQIFDEDFELVAEAAAVQESSWRPKKPLARGRVYWWEVRGDDTTVAAGKFKVLGNAELRMLTSIDRSASVIRGLALYRFGLVTEAKREFERAAKNDPDGPAAKFLQQLNSR